MAGAAQLLFDARSGARSRQSRAALLFLAPALVVLAVLLAYPVALFDPAVADRRQAAAGRLEAPFIGLDNYAR